MRAKTDCPIGLVPRENRHRLFHTTDLLWRDEGEPQDPALVLFLIGPPEPALRLGVGPRGIQIERISGRPGFPDAGCEGVAVEILDDDREPGSSGVDHDGGAITQQGASANDLGERAGFRWIVDAPFVGVTADNGMTPGLMQQRKPKAGTMAGIPGISLKRSAIILAWASPQRDVGEDDPERGFGNIGAGQLSGQPPGLLDAIRLKGRCAGKDGVVIGFILTRIESEDGQWPDTSGGIPRQPRAEPGRQDRAEQPGVAAASIMVAGDIQQRARGRPTAAG